MLMFAADLLETLLIVPTTLVLAVTAVFAAQAAAALTLEDRPRARSSGRPRAAVIVPAHDEAGTIAASVSSLMRETAPSDRVVVVADNCSDETGELAAKAGAEVVVRSDPSRIGKGFALEAGLDHLRSDPPTVVAFIDADCRLSQGGLEALARDCAAAAAPVQCLDLMRTHPGGADQSRLAEFAWRIRNDLRPTGYARLGLPCQLFGTGMAIPWAIVDAVDWGTNHLAEDLAMGLRFTLNGTPPQFLKSVKVTSYFPASANGRAQQRRRWLHGHLEIALGEAAPALVSAAWRLSVPLFALVMDLLVPPLALLGLAILLLLAPSLALGLLWGLWAPAALCGAALSILASSLAGAWLYCGRDLIGLPELVEAPRHVFRGASAAFEFARGARSSWVRAERKGDLAAHGTPSRRSSFH